MHRAIMQIYQNASPETRACYDLAHDTKGNIEAENWIIRWCLWHVFRDRDQRKKSRACVYAQPAGVKAEVVARRTHYIIIPGPSMHEVQGPLGARAVVDRSVLPYDPVRDC